ncbi:MAG TPA: glycoside hydrolase, partial [Methylomirabilota bacterium]|nr:glycoside hydrolase [Methylomirabilota bacterium]
VVFRRAAAAPARTLPGATTTVLATLAGPWSVRFPPNWGAPPEVRLDRLVSWTASADPGVKYFSGTATYEKDLQARPPWFRPGAKVMLDLGDVKEIAEVSVNGTPFGILWKPPFQADVTAALRPGSNHLEIKVTNLWPNRMIGDQQPSATKAYTFTDYKAYTRDSPLLESGLLGPVTLLAVTSR